MSNMQNELWCEAAMEHFAGAIEEGNYGLALDVIADTRDKGFVSLSRNMQEQLYQTPVGKFSAFAAAQRGVDYQDVAPYLI